VAVKNGPTSAAYPTRVNDYGFYRAMVEYVEAKVSLRVRYAYTANTCSAG
jgi:hypothetical protein